MNMRIYTPRIFNDKKKLAEMLELRNQGWTVTNLSRRYNCHYSSIINQANKYGIKAKEKPIREYESVRKYEKRDDIPKVDVKIITEKDKKMGIGKRNQGKNYADYLKEYGMKLIFNSEGYEIINNKKKISSSELQGKVNG